LPSRTGEKGEDAERRKGMQTGTRPLLLNSVQKVGPQEPHRSSKENMNLGGTNSSREKEV